MLYDKRWEKANQATDYTLDLRDLVLWLEKQPAKKRYCYMDDARCLFGKYFRHLGFKDIEVGGTGFSHSGTGGRRIEMTIAVQDIPADHPRTFGAALERAKKLSPQETE
jgi:hypothetical protein